MAGQGRPRREKPARAGHALVMRHTLGRVLLVLLIAVLPTLLARGVFAAEGQLRLRVAWGGGESRAWQGTIRLSEGRILDFAPLGLEADTPGSMGLTPEGELRVASRSPRTYDGCDLALEAPPEARLIVEFNGADGAPLRPVEILLSKAARGLQDVELDGPKNRLLVQRQPGDQLPVTLSRDSLVFATGEKFEFSVLPRSLDLSPNSTYVLSAAVTYARTTDVVIDEEHELRTNAAAVPEAETSFAIPLPQSEGVYDVRLSLYPKRITTPIVKGKAVLERRVQVMVLEPVKLAPKRDYLSLNPFATLAGEPTTWESVLEFDPAHSRWWEKMTRLPTINKIPGIGQQTYGSQTPKIRPHLDQSLVELQGSAWQAYPLSLTNLGMPHVLEVEYPSDLPQTLQVSIVEPNGAGEVTPISLDTGLDVPSVATNAKGEMRRHKIIFWPQTKSPLVLLVNRRENEPAYFGKIRVVAGPKTLEVARSSTAAPTRLLAAWLDKPLLCENFSAPEAVDDVTGQSRRDWLTFYLAAKRLVEYLEHTGRNGVVLSIAGEGSTLYPSRILQPTPQYDGGIFFESGQDPQRKDVVEMLLRLCDRSGIQFIPAVRFSTPLPELEVLRNDSQQDLTGLFPVGSDGGPPAPGPKARQGEKAHYNPLDPRVQQAMRHVVEEIAQRYGHHPSFGGIAVQLEADGFGALCDETVSLDDATFARFLAETGLSIRDEGERRFDARARLVRSAEGSLPWLDWRAEQLATLYREMEADIARTHAGARLYLNTSELFATRQMQLALRPALPQPAEGRSPLLLFGIDPERFVKQPNIVVPRPQRIVPSTTITRNLHANWNSQRELDALFTRPAAAAIHYHEPAPLKLASFDKESPFGPEKTHTFFVPSIAPTGELARQPLVHSLAVADVHTLLAGGWTMPLGEEESLTSVLGVYRRLPAESFQTLVSPGGNASEPVVVRTLSRGNKTYFYLVNDSPWPLSVDVDMDCPEMFQLDSYVADRPGKFKRQASRSIWTVAMQPYDLVGGELSSGKVKLGAWRVAFTEDVQAPVRERIHETRLRASALRDPLPRDLLSNPSFELAPKGGRIPGWRYPMGAGIQVEIDETQGYKSGRSLHLVSRPAEQKAAPIIWVRSEPIVPPKTGRLSVLAWIRIDDPRRQPKLRLAVEGKLDGKGFYRRANVGASEAGLAVRPLQKQWAPYRFPLTDLPLEGLSDIRIGFDLMGEGDVYIDEVSVFDLWFEENERDELLKNIATADIQLTNGQVADCERFLDGYWSRYLQEHVSPAAPRVASVPAPVVTRPEVGQEPSLPTRRGPLAKRGGVESPAAKEPAEAEKPSMLERMKSWLPKSPFR